VIVEERLVERSEQLGQRALARLRAGLADLPRVREVRGRGLMLAIELREQTAHAAAVALAEEGVLVKDTHGHTLRILPPLVIDESTLDEAVDAVIRVVARH
jgi:acetylornithine aminotransferase